MCRGFGLSRDSTDRIDLKAPRCWAWSCEDCAPLRQRMLIAQLHNGEPTKFLTLTCRWVDGMDPVATCGRMMRAWNKLLKRLRRFHGDREVEAFWVLEETKEGAPHLHIALRMPYTAQRFISQWWRDLTGWYIVDIRNMAGFKDRVRYVAKYLGKGPGKFGNHKRYSRTRRYLKDWHRPEPEQPKFGEPRWQRLGSTLGEALHLLVSRYHWIDQTDERHWIAWKLGHWPCRAWAVPWVGFTLGPAPGGCSDATIP